VRSDAETRRLIEAREHGVAWRKWGPYLSERQWGTVREDYSPFYACFHGDDGAGIGASHQTGWTGLVAKLLQLFGTIAPETVLSRGARAAGGLPAPPG
jgi:hypothetical protein